MDRIECAGCGMMITDPKVPCPHCGGTDWLLMYNLLRDKHVRESFTFSVRHRHKQWPYQVKGIVFNLNMIEGQADTELVKGLCDVVITKTAALVEAVLTDHLKEEWESWLFDESRRDTYKLRLEKVPFKAWPDKKKFAKEVGWDLSLLSGFDKMDTLFLIRDNLTHGASYDLVDNRVFKETAFVRDGPVEISVDSYQRAFAALLAEELVHSMDHYPHCTSEAFLSPAVARWAFDNSVSFIRDFFDKVKLSNHYNMRPEFERPLQEAMAK